MICERIPRHQLLPGACVCALCVWPVAGDCDDNAAEARLKRQRHKKGATGVLIGGSPTVEGFFASGSGCSRCDSQV